MEPPEEFNSLVVDEDKHQALREILMLDSDEPMPWDLVGDEIERMRTLVEALDDGAASLLRLEFSLCPLHRRDYAICFDDDEPECAALRLCFPSHDT